MNVERTPDPFITAIVTDAFNSDQRKAIVDGLGEEIEQAIRGVLFQDEVLDALGGISPTYQLYGTVNNHTATLQILEDKTQPKLGHGVFTVLTFFKDDDTSASVVFQFDDTVAYEVDVADNQLLIFPSSYYHYFSRIDGKLYVSEISLYIEID